MTYVFYSIFDGLSVTVFDSLLIPYFWETIKWFWGHIGSWGWQSNVSLVSKSNKEKVTWRGLLPECVVFFPYGLQISHIKKNGQQSTSFASFICHKKAIFKQQARFRKRKNKQSNMFNKQSNTLQKQRLAKGFCFKKQTRIYCATKGLKHKNKFQFFKRKRTGWLKVHDQLKGCTTNV